MPVQLIKYLIPKDVFPTSMLITDESQLYLSGSLSFTPERQGEYIWMPQWFDIISKIWLVAIIIFAIYQIISFWRGAHSIQNYIFDKVEDSDNNQVYYLIPDGICGPCTIGFFRQKIVFPESFPMLHSEYDMVYKHEHSHLKNNLFSNKKKSGKNMKILKRRINYMMKEKKKGLLQRGIMVAVSALTIVTGAGTVLAYEPMQSSDISVEESITFDTPEITSFEFSGEFVSTEDFSESDNIFVTLDGEQIPIYDMTVPHALCTHSMVNGYLKNHTSNGKGGCTVKVYTCQRCEKCGYLANAVYKNTITYAVCPH